MSRLSLSLAAGFSSLLIVPDSHMVPDPRLSLGQIAWAPPYLLLSGGVLAAGRGLFVSGSTLW